MKDEQSRCARFGRGVKLANAKLDQGKPVEALHLAEIALAASPDNEPGLRAQLAAYEKLLEESNDENHYEVFWLRHLIAESRSTLGISD